MSTLKLLKADFKVSRNLDTVWSKRKNELSI